MHEMFPGISKLLGDLLSFPLYCFSLFLCIDHWGRLYLCAIFWNSAFKWVYLSFSPLPLASLLSAAICKTSSDNHFAFLHFFFVEMVLITASYTMSRTSVHSSSGTLSDLIPWISLSLLLYTVEVRNRFKGLDLIDRVSDEEWNEVRDIVQETGIKTIPMGKKCKNVNGCLGMSYK